MAGILAALPGLFEVTKGIMDYNRQARAEGRGLMTRQRKVIRHGGLLSPAGAGVRKRKYVHHDKVIRNRKRGGRVVKRRRMRKGKGFLSDFVGNVPLIGGILGPILKGIGAGALMPYSRGQKLRGTGLAPMYIAGMRQRLGCGLLMPAGGRLKVSRVKPHYRYVKRGNGMRYKRVHVAGHKMRRGGYVPYTSKMY